MQPSERSSDQKRHIRQALADLVFGLALFVLFVLLGVFGVKQASSGEAELQGSVRQVQSAIQPQKNDNSVFPDRPVSPGQYK